MIHFFVGTKAQLIKLAPIMLELRRRGIPFRDIDSGQHASITRALRSEFGLDEPDLRLSNRRDNVTSIAGAVAWYSLQWMRGAAPTARLRQHVFPGGGICLIHGDTLSTLLGCQLARSAGLVVGHVEAGLRTSRRLDPFPEELIRGYCSRRADLLFAPFAEAERHLAQSARPGQSIHMVGNTIADAVRLFSAEPADLLMPAATRFALVTCHRAETIFRSHRLRQVVALINRVAREMPVVFVQHEPTRRQMLRFKLDQEIDARVLQSDVMGYGRFIAHLRAASLVISDGGSIQEECALLGKRCLILREVSERPDGIGATARIWRFDNRLAEDMIADARAAPPRSPDPSPAASIVDTLVQRGYGRRTATA